MLALLLFLTRFGVHAMQVFDECREIPLRLCIVLILLSFVGCAIDVLDDAATQIPLELLGGTTGPHVVDRLDPALVVVGWVIDSFGLFPRWGIYDCLRIAGGNRSAQESTVGTFNPLL